MTVDNTKSNRPIEYVIAEYESAQALFQHYDGFRWQAGSILVAGAFIFLGLLSTGSGNSRAYIIGSILVVVILSAWILFAYHYRQLYLFKIDRIIELEFEMGAEQNRRFHPNMGTVKQYPKIGPRGHNLDLVIYCAMSLAGPGLALVNGAWTAWQLLPIAMTLATALTIQVNDRRLRRWLSANRTPQLPKVNNEATRPI